LAPQALGAVIRRFGDFDAAEDGVQEALLAASVHWPEEGLPDNPVGWLIRTASRSMTDQFRSEVARRRREELVSRQDPMAPQVAENDDTLTLLFMCCHPALTPPSAIALTLRAVGGLTTAEIAAAYLVPEATMAQRISRAKQSIKAS
jgi:RNA polymerase sigma factor (sigma-70 family)